jgi:hypothetical protein
VSHRDAATGILVTVLLMGASACVMGDGEGPRFTGRVTKVSPSEICVGPSTSSRTETCGSTPAGFTDLPRIGQCVSLFPRFSDHGRRLTWTRTSLRLKVDDAECRD